MRYLSLFSGIEAASCAWQPLGWKAAGFAETDKFASAVLAHRYPDTPNLGDITEIQDEDIRALGPVDLIVGGFPCQDLSVAGKRKGLKNKDGTSTRSGLFFDAMRLVRAANPRWLLIENVPGLYSSNGGRDFASVVGEILGCSFSVPRGGWRNSGIAAGPRGRVEWATLDAQFFGLAQRRKRVFLVANFGDWANTPPVLLEPESMHGHPAPRRQQGERAAPTISARPTGGGGLGTDFDLDGGLIAHTLRGEGFDSSEDGTGRGTPIVPVMATGCHGANGAGVGLPGDPMFTLDCTGAAAIAFGGNRTSGALEIAAALNAKGGSGRCDFESETLVAFDCKAGANTGFAIGDVPGCLRGEGHGGGHAAFAGSAGVRRITPREAERLQGFPDDYTLVPLPLKGRQTRIRYAADGPRYKTLGNSFAVPVVRWIGHKIQEADQACRDRTHQL